MGGRSVGREDSCEYYDVNKDEWNSFTSLNEKIVNPSASILNNKFIYLFGGVGGV